MQKNSLDKLFWIDLEMTGLDVEKEVIIEVAVVLADLKFEVLEEYHSVVRQPQTYLDSMDDWNRTHHKESGLLALIAKGKAPEAVEADLLDFISRHYAQEEKPVLAGNSIMQDRLFIRKYWTQLEARLHYRMLDVSAWKIVFQNIHNLKFEKRRGHRALDDIYESIDELKFYIGKIDPGRGLPSGSV
jgi:oligoribonuclease